MKALLVDRVLFWTAVACAMLTGFAALVCVLAGSWYALVAAACTAFWVVLARAVLDDIRAERES